MLPGPLKTLLQISLKIPQVHWLPLSASLDFYWDRGSLVGDSLQHVHCAVLWQGMNAALKNIQL